MRKSSRIFRLPARLNDYEVTFNCTSVKYHIQNVCSFGLNYPKFVCLMSNLDKVCEPGFITKTLNEPN